MSDWEDEVVDRYTLAIEANGLDANTALRDLTKVVSMRLGEDARQAEAERDRISKSYDEVADRLRMVVRRTHRLTKLMRSALPKDEAIGNGFDGMVESVLARMVRLAAERDSLRFELDGLELIRQRDNEYLIKQRDAAIEILSGIRGNGYIVSDPLGDELDKLVDACQQGDSPPHTDEP